MITNNTATVISNNLYDTFGVLRYQQGSAETPWRWLHLRADDDGTVCSRIERIFVATSFGALGANVVSALAKRWIDRFRFDHDCLRECFYDFIVGFGAGCAGAIMEAGKPCALCVGAALLSCAVSPPSCSLALGLCSSVCGAGVIRTCLMAGVIGGVANLLICYRSCVREKQPGVVAIPISVICAEMAAR